MPSPPARCTIEGGSFGSNVAVHGGGAHSNGTVAVTDATFSANHGIVENHSSGAGLDATGAVSIERSTFSANHIDEAASPFPLLCHFDICLYGDLSALGGGAASSTSLAVSASTFDGNAVDGGLDPGINDQLFGDAAGGGARRPERGRDRLDVRRANSSVQLGIGANFQLVSVPGFGGAIQATQLLLTHATVTRSSGANAIAVRTLVINTSVLHGIAPSGGTECGPAPSTTSTGYDVTDDASCNLTGVHDTVTTTDPLLAPLANNWWMHLYTRTPRPPPPASSSTSSPLPTSRGASGTDQPPSIRPRRAGLRHRRSRALSRELPHGCPRTPARRRVLQAKSSSTSPTGLASAGRWPAATCSGSTPRRSRMSRSMKATGKKRSFVAAILASGSPAGSGAGTGLS